MTDLVVTVQREVVVTPLEGTPIVDRVPDAVSVVVVQPEIVCVQVDSGPVLHVDVGIPGPAGLPGSGSGSGSGGVFVQSVVSVGGIVSDFVWAAPNKHLKSAVTDSEVLTITALVEGGLDAYQPKTTINGVEAVVTETGTTRVFQATAAISVPIGDSNIYVVASTGARDVLKITRLSGGPAISSIEVQNPGVPQTHYRSGQTVRVIFLTNSSAIRIKVHAWGASASEVEVPVVGGMAEAQVTISAVSSTSKIRAQAFNSFGTSGEVKDSSDVPIDQVVPSLSLNVVYPNGQYALKYGERAVLTTNTSGSSSVSYEIPEGILCDTGYSPSKELVCDSHVAEYVHQVVAIARKESNASHTIIAQAIRIANLEPSLVVSIDGNSQRLIRATLGTAYTLRVVSSQPLISLSIPGVTMSASADRMTWTGVIKVFDYTPTGSYVVTVSVVGAAGHAGVVSRTFIVGGFSSRSITWPAFSRVAALNLSVYDHTRTICIVGTKTLALQYDATDRAGGYYIADANAAYNPNGNFIALSDVAFALANTSGILQGTAQEA